MIQKVNKNVKKVTECEIHDVFKSIISDKIVISIFSPDENDDLMFKKEDQIKIDQISVFDRLLNLKKNKQQILYLTDGMTDIDIYIQGKNFVISKSPIPGNFTFYIFDIKEFNKLINIIKNYKKRNKE